MNQSVEKRIDELRGELNRHNRLYYVDAAPEVSDREYDLLFEELQALEKSHPHLVTPDSPTQRVGGEPLKQFANVSHNPPMLSLEKAENGDALERFDRRLRKVLGAGIVLDYVVEPKVDGVSIALRYENGGLVLAATRGDGVTGDDITANARTIRGVPLKLPDALKFPEYLEVRGEVYMDREEFAELNKRLDAAGEKTFPSARNAAAGSLKQLDPRIVAGRPLRVVVYAVATLDAWEGDSHYETLQTLKRLGFPVPRYFWRCGSIADALTRAEECKGLTEKLPFDIDGAVIKFDGLRHWERIGATAHHPQYAVAYKPRHWLQQALTRIRDITIQVGRTGTLTPVAELEPVFLAGSTIERATLHNADDISRKDIRIGDTVVIERAGMVIPSVVKSMPESRSGDERKFCMPGNCPVCGGQVARRFVAREREAVAWRCENLQCPAQKTRRLAHFASRAALDIEGLGDIVADALTEHGWVDEPLDLFNLRPDRLAALNLGTADKLRVFGPKNAARLISALERARRLSLERWLFALAVPGVGVATARRLAELHSSLEAVATSGILADIVKQQHLEEAVRGANPRRRNQDASPASAHDSIDAQKRYDDLKKQYAEVTRRIAKYDATDIGPVAARSVLEYFASDQGRRALERCSSLGIDPRPAVAGHGGEPARGGIAGKTFVVTGSLTNMSRAEAEAAIRAAGGSVVAAVSGKTDCLVAGANPGETKLRQARELNVSLIEEHELLERLGVAGGHVALSSPESADLPQQGELFD